MANLDRQSLTDTARRYLDAVIAHDPQRAPLHFETRFTHNGNAVRPGEGYWRDIERFAGETFFVDTKSAQLIVMGTAHRNAQPWPWALRLRMQEDGKIIESESVLSSEAKGYFTDADQLLKSDIIYDALVPPKRALDRVGLRAAADSYWEALESGDGDLPKFHFRCDRYQNGAKITYNMRLLMSSDAAIHTCASAIKHAARSQPRVRERRYPVLDVERGVAAGFIVVDFSAVPDAGKPEAVTHYMMSVTKIVDGRLRIIDEIRESVPLGAVSGW
jgi:hypothetical protein